MAQAEPALRTLHFICLTNPHVVSVDDDGVVPRKPGEWQTTPRRERARIMRMVTKKFDGKPLFMVTKIEGRPLDDGDPLTDALCDRGKTTPTPAPAEWLADRDARIVALAERQAETKSQLSSRAALDVMRGLKPLIDLANAGAAEEAEAKKTKKAAPNG